MDSVQVSQTAGLQRHLMTSDTGNDSCRLCLCTESLVHTAQCHPHCIHLYLYTDTHAPQKFDMDERWPRVKASFLLQFLQRVTTLHAASAIAFLSVCPLSAGIASKLMNVR